MKRSIARFASALSTLAVGLAACALSAQAPQGSSAHGVQIGNMDRGVRPGDDFFLYANGAWVKRTVIPPDRTSVSGFSEVADRTDKQVAGLIEDAAKSNAAAGTECRKMADLYHSYMDEAAIEQRGLAPMKPEFGRIAAIKTRRDLAHTLGESLRADVDPLNNTNFHTANLFGMWVAPGFGDPGHYAPYLLAGGLTLPSRDFYLNSGEHMNEVREKFAAHAATMFRLAGFDQPQMRAQRVIALEHAIAEVQQPLADNENIAKANNRWTEAEFASKAPGLDWAEYFRAAGLGNQMEFYVWQPAAFMGEAALVASTPLDTWKDWLVFHRIEADAAFAPRALADERFAFFGTVLTGAQQQRPREQRALGIVNLVLGDAVGQIYAARYFSPQAKAEAQALVNNLLAAFRQRLEAITWMAPGTKAEAIAKLGTLQVGVGYPDHWRSYAGLEIRPDDVSGNIERSRMFEYTYQRGRIGQPVDRKEWCMEPQTVNAVNLPLDNGLNFPAAILQPPFFDAKAPAAFNYGAIGSVIGHEISHTFDSEGAAFDSEGRVRNWWTTADLAHFDAATAALAAQFDTYEPLPGLHVNGRQTLGEDIADLGGIAASFDAYHASLHGQAAPVVEGLSGDQQFFLAFGQNWQSKARDAALRQQLLTDPHAPGQDRAQTVRNLDAWYTNFKVTPDQKLYLSPNKRVRIW